MRKIPTSTQFDTTPRHRRRYLAENSRRVTPLKHGKQTSKSIPERLVSLVVLKANGRG